jgi:xanthine dehydrogenase accessory factor
MDLAFHETVAGLLRAGHTVAVATLVGCQGSTPRGFGAKMIVVDDGSTVFSIGGGAFEALIIEDAREAIRQGRGGEKEYRFTEQGENATGMVCGGSARVLIEIVRAPQALFVFGAGHVGREVARLAAGLGFRVTVVDDRASFLDPARFPEGVRTACAGEQFAAGLPEIPAGAYVAILTRCHRTDLEALRHVCRRGAAYVGVIGSRRKITTLLARARERGVREEDLAGLHAPIGVRIGAQTPQEIAVSIAAEIIAVRRAAEEAADRPRPALIGLAGARSPGSSPRPARSRTTTR